MENPPYACSVCGKLHPVADLSFATDFPDSYVNMSKDARDARALIGSDQCVIDQAQFYLRGCIELPVRESEGSFLWGVWARECTKWTSTSSQNIGKLKEERK